MLQFMSIDIVETGSAHYLDTSAYEILVQKVNKTLEEKIDVTIDAASDERPTSLEQVKELRNDMDKLLKHLQQQQEGSTDVLVFVYALVDLLQQLEHAKVAAKGDKSLWDQECCQEFREEAEKL